MIKQLGRPEVQAFLKKHGEDDPTRVALMKNVPGQVAAALLASQLKARQKAKDKLPSWLNRDGIIFPHGVAMEQCSSENTALWKARAAKGNRFADLTGGTGVDSWAFSKVFAEGFFVETDAERCELAAHNFKALGATNMSVVHASAEEFVKHSSQTFDLIYLDPDRRAGRSRVVGFGDSTPDVAALLPSLQRMAPLVLIKASPMLDIKEGISMLKTVDSVTVLALNNEVKELLFFCGVECSNESPRPVISAVNISSTGTEETFRFSFLDEQMASAEFSEPLAYIYEPNAALLKAGAFKTVALSYSLKKLHTNTHLYTSESVNTSFPGRIFEVLEMTDFSSAGLKTGSFSRRRAHVVTRNFPLRADELQKKLKIDEGEDAFVIGTTTLQNRKILISAERLK